MCKQSLWYYSERQQVLLLSTESPAVGEVAPEFVGPTFTVVPPGKSDKTLLALDGAQLHGIWVLLRQERQRNRMIPRGEVELDACITVIGEALKRSGFLARREQQIQENLALYLGRRKNE